MRIENLTNVTPLFSSEGTDLEVNAPVSNIRTVVKRSEEYSVDKRYNHKDLEKKSKYALSTDEAIWMDMINRTNKAITGSTCSFEYSIHDVTKEIMIKVIDKDTKEVIREIPPEKILDLVAKLWEIAGILVDERR